MTRPVPILMYFAFNRTYTGGPRLIASLVERLDRARWRPVFVSQVESPLTEAVRESGAECHVVPLPGVLDVYGGAATRYPAWKKAAALGALRTYNRRIADLGRRAGVRGIWSRNVKSVLFTAGAARTLGVPLVWDIGLEPPSRGLLRALHLYALSAADTVVTEAEALPRSIFGPRLAHAFRGKFVANYPGITPERAAALAAVPAAPPADGAFTVLNVATVQPRKNQMLLVQALARLGGRYPGLRVQVAGADTDPAYAARVREAARREGVEERLELLGWRDDVPALVSRADLVVSCSHDEGVPHALMEAMHAGVPAVATAVGGVPEMIEHGRTGWLVPDGDAAELARWIAFCADHPGECRAAGARAREVVAERFSIDAWAARYDAVLARAFAPNPAPSAPAAAAAAGAR